MRRTHIPAALHWMHLCRPRRNLPQRGGGTPAFMHRLIHLVICVRLHRRGSGRGGVGPGFLSHGGAGGWGEGPPAAPIMRAGGTKRGRGALKSVRRQGSVCPCMEQIGLIMFRLCGGRKVALISLQLLFVNINIYIFFSFTALLP